jgi:RNA polymerase sigma factor (sigma-70 family)
MASPSWRRLVCRVDSADGHSLQDSGRSALIETYLARRTDLVRFFTLRLRSAASAEDLVQDIYLRLHAVTDTDIQNPTGYLYRLGTNLMLDRLRGARRSASRDEACRDSHHTVIGSQDFSDEPTAEHVVAAREGLNATIAALKDLPPLTQQVFWKHKFEGMTHPEVAATLGVSRSAVEKHVMAALRHLSERLR